MFSNQLFFFTGLVISNDFKILMWFHRVLFRFFYGFSHQGDGLDGEFSDGGFVGEHYCVHAGNDGIVHVGDFRSGREGRGGHTFEEFGRHNAGSAVFFAGGEDVVLEVGELMDGGFDAEVASGYHNSIGDLDDFIDVFDSFLVFYFRDYLRITDDFF